MKVNELIKELEKYDPETPVCVTELEYDDVDGFIEINDVVSLVQFKENHYNNDLGNEVHGKFISIRA